MGFWETLVADLASRGGLAGALATFYSLAIVGWWIGHVRLIRRRAERMPIRILVTGTRGKSSVVRLLHAALRHAGYRVSGKTTGTAARTLVSDGSERSTLRLGQVSILETVGLISSAAKHDANALVTECMAVNPSLIRQLSADIVRPTIVDVTNAQLDHLEEEGTDRRAIMRSLASAVTASQTVVTAERDPMAIWELQQRCHANGAPLIVVDGGAFAADGAPIVPGAHPDNVSLALATTRACAIPDDVAIAGMRESTHEPQDSEVLRGQLGGRSVRYCSLGSINDADNVVPAIGRVLGDRKAGVPRIALLFGRSDRPLRALLFAGLMSVQMFDGVVITGGPEAMVRRALIAGGWPAERVLRMGIGGYSVRVAGRRIAALAHSIEPASDEFELVGLENVHVPLASALHRYLGGGS